MSKFVEKTYISKKEILKFPDHYVNVAITLTDAGVTATDGKKIIKAGSVIGSSVTNKTILGDEVAGKVVTDGTAEGILFYDVDVTYGPAPAALLIHGFIDETKLPVAPTTDSKTALKQVVFLK
jgi:hypothetical protein